MADILATVDDVRYAYRLLMDREPDPAGFATFSALVKTTLVSPRDLAAYFLGSNEFRMMRGEGPIEVDVGGCIVFVPANDSAVGAGVQSGGYEPHVRAAMDNELRRGDTFLDVGANIGYYTALAAHRVGNEGSVLAFEPMDKNLQLIYAARERNGYDWISVHPVAASDADRIVGMSTHGGSSNGEIVREWHGASLPLYAQTRRLDDVLAHVQRIDVAKFDIEGHELHAWNGGKGVLERHSPIILTEFHPHCLRENGGTDPLDYARVLLSYGEVRVLHRDGSRVRCLNEGQIMKQWRQEDATLGTHGGAHLDLLVRPSARK